MVLAVGIVVAIVPFPVSFTSKMLFGFAAAFTFWAFRRKLAAKD